MQTVYDVLTIPSAIFVAAVLLFVPLSFVAGIFNRIRMKRVLRELGFTNIKIEKKRCGYGLPISYVEHGTKKATVIRDAYGDHFQLCADKRTV